MNITMIPLGIVEDDKKDDNIDLPGRMLVIIC